MSDPWKILKDQVFNQARDSWETLRYQCGCSCFFQRSLILLLSSMSLRGCSTLNPMTISKVRKISMNHTGDPWLEYCTKDEAKWELVPVGEMEGMSREKSAACRPEKMKSSQRHAGCALSLGYNSNMHSCCCKVKSSIWPRKAASGCCLARHKNQRAKKRAAASKKLSVSSFRRNLGCQTNGTKTCLRCDTQTCQCHVVRCVLGEVLVDYVDYVRVWLWKVKFGAKSHQWYRKNIKLPTINHQKMCRWTNFYEKVRFCQVGVFGMTFLQGFNESDMDLRERLAEVGCGGFRSGWTVRIPYGYWYCEDSNAPQTSGANQ